jgi:chemotaxis protein histidine kinase CheA
VATWAEDPELLATFRAEVDDRLASLTAGLLQLENNPAPKHLIASLFRDAHTVKGSARMMGLQAVLETAHAAEDLLGALRDGRFAVRRDLVDLLLATADGIGRAIPGTGDPLAEDHLAELVNALRGALAGADPVVVPRTPRADPPAGIPVTTAPVPAELTAEASPMPAASPMALLPVPGRAGDRAIDSVRVTSQRVYDLLDVVGEAELDARRVERCAIEVVALMAEQNRWLRSLRTAMAASSAELPVDVDLAIHRIVSGGDQLQAAGHQLRSLVEDARGRLALVRDGAIGLAMVPVRRVVAAFPRLVREVSGSGAGGPREVRLVLLGEDVELDKKVLDGVADALKHLVINAVDHGCEPAAERLRNGKSALATVTVSAKAAGGTVVLDVQDDGRGIDEDQVRTAAIARGLLSPDSTLSGSPLLQLLFLPAFSTSDTITTTSGRGVGLDVVRNAVDGLGGTIDISSELGVGTHFVLTLPVTLGVLRCLIARVGDERYAIPVPGVMESISLRDVQVGNVAGVPVVLRHGVSIPLVDLGSALGAAGDRDPRAALVARHNGAGDLIAWSVDRLEGELELVVKDLGAFIGRLPMVTGATIDGDGTVVCLIDLREIAGRAITASYAAAAASVSQPNGSQASGRDDEKAVLQHKARVLVIEDSVGVRELERVILESAGYEVTTAVDGLDGVARLRGEPADLVLSDVEMPGMDGFALTRTVRRTRGWEQVPVVIMTSRGDEGDRRAGLEAGASAYLLKSDFDQTELVDTVRRLIGR